MTLTLIKDEELAGKIYPLFASPSYSPPRFVDTEPSRSKE